MENTNVVNEVVENTNEFAVVEETSNKKAAIAGAVVGGLIVTGLLVKLGIVVTNKWIKPAIAKAKAKKAAKANVIDVDCEPVDED